MHPFTTLRAMLLVLATLAFCHTVPACATLERVLWPKVAECGGDLVEDLLGVVSRILLAGSADMDQQLVDLGKQYGTEAVACVVNEVVQGWRRPGASQTPETEAAAARGEAFLHGHGVEEVRLE